MFVPSMMLECVVVVMKDHLLRRMSEGMVLRQQWVLLMQAVVWRLQLQIFKNIAMVCFLPGTFLNYAFGIYLRLFYLMFRTGE
jgi:hypothetical protein